MTEHAAPVAADALPPAVTDAFHTALAIAIDPTGSDEAVQAIPADRLLAFIWVCDELVRRLNAAKKGAVIEATLALEHGEITDPRIAVGGSTFQLRQDSKNEYDNIGGLFYVLNRLGASVTDLGNAVGYVRVGDLQKIVAALPEDVRSEAGETLDAHRVKKPTGWALVNLDSPYRKGKR